MLVRIPLPCIIYITYVGTVFPPKLGPLFTLGFDTGWIALSKPHSLFQISASLSLQWESCCTSVTSKDLSVSETSLLYSEDLSDLPVHIFCNMSLKLCLVSISHVSSSEGLRNQSVAWFGCLTCARSTVGCSIFLLPNWCWAELEKLPSKPRLSSCSKVSVECWLHSDHTKNFIYKKNSPF